MNKIININSILKSLDSKMTDWASNKVISKIGSNVILGNKLSRSDINE